MSLAQFFGIDKLQKLARMVKEHGGVKASLYHFYLTDDLKVRGQLGRNVVFQRCGSGSGGSESNWPLGSESVISLSRIRSWIRI
jgi:hypothetical protein